MIVTKSPQNNKMYTITTFVLFAGNNWKTGMLQTKRDADYLGSNIIAIWSITRKTLKANAQSCRKTISCFQSEQDHIIIIIIVKAWTHFSVLVMICQLLFLSIDNLSQFAFNNMLWERVYQCIMIAWFFLLIIITLNDKPFVCLRIIKIERDLKTLLEVPRIKAWRLQRYAVLS